MILDRVLSLKTDERILNAVQQSFEKRMSPQEISEQRISFVFSSIGGEKSGVTKEHVREVFREQGGLPRK